MDYYRFTNNRHFLYQDYCVTFIKSETVQDPYLQQHISPKTMAVLHSLCEVARSGGDYTLLGGKSKNEIDFSCADGVIKFRLTSKHSGG